MKDANITNCDIVNDNIFVFVNIAFDCMAFAATPKKDSIDIHKHVVFRNACLGPLASNCLPYNSSNTIDIGLTQVIANLINPMIFNKVH